MRRIESFFQGRILAHRSPGGSEDETELRTVDLTPEPVPGSNEEFGGFELLPWLGR